MNAYVSAIATAAVASDTAGFPLYTARFPFEMCLNTKIFLVCIFP